VRCVYALRVLLLQKRYHQQSNDVDDLDQWVDCRACRIFVRIAYSIAGDCSFVSIRALAAAVAVFYDVAV
jgi:hypothetical protein